MLYLVNVERPEVYPLWVVTQHALQHTSPTLSASPWALELVHGCMYNDLKCISRRKDLVNTPFYISSHASSKHVSAELNKFSSMPMQSTGLTEWRDVIWLIW